MGLRPGAVALLIAASICACTADHDAVDLIALDIGLLDASSTALILGPTGIPTPSGAYADAAARLYLDPLGFEGQTVVLTTPETSDWDASVNAGVADLVAAVLADDPTAADPLTVFGYSQSAVIASAAMPLLYAGGVPLDALRFVMVGDTAAAPGRGFLAWLDQLLHALQLGWLAAWLHISDIIDVTTPTDLYSTSVFTLGGDAFADTTSYGSLGYGFDWLGFAVGTVVHDEYLGLSADQIELSAVSTDGAITYYDVPAGGIDTWDALLSAAATL